MGWFASLRFYKVANVIVFQVAVVICDRSCLTNLALSEEAAKYFPTPLLLCGFFNVRVKFFWKELVLVEIVLQSV